jgi:hypothetical protein
VKLIQVCLGVVLLGCHSSAPSQLPEVVRVGDSVVPKGESPCAWAIDHGYPLSLIVGSDVNENVVALTVAMPGTCQFDRKSTARTLVFIALGGYAGPTDSRTALWDLLERASLEPVEDELERSSSLTVLLGDSARIDALVDALVLVTSAIPQPAEKQEFVPDPRGTDGLTFSNLRLGLGGREVMMDVEAPNNSDTFEFKSLVVNDRRVGLIRGADLFGVRAGPRATLSLDVSSARAADRRISLHVIAPSITDPWPSLTLFETAERFATNQYSLESYFYEAMLFFLPDFADSCIAGSAGAVTAAAIDVVNAQHESKLSLALAILGKFPDVGSEIFVNCWALSDLKRKLLKIALSYLQRVAGLYQVYRALVSYGGGPTIAYHEISVCDLCPDRQCTISGGAATCGSACSCSDGDGDGYFQPSCTDANCPLRTDCDDTSLGVHPGAVDICGNGVDEDCVGGDCIAACSCSDADGDHFYSLSCADTNCSPRTDCDNMNSAVHPSAVDICGNGVDEDCAGGDCTTCPGGGNCNGHGSCSMGQCSCVTGYDNPAGGCNTCALGYSGYPSCSARPTYLSYGCSNYVAACTANCFACTTEHGFFAYNDMGGCGGGTCIRQFPGLGTYSPLVVMLTNGNMLTAHARFFFADAAGNPQTLSGNYRISVSIPANLPSLPVTSDPSCMWSLNASTTYTLHNSASQVLMTQAISQGSSTGLRTLFSGNLTGGYYVTVSNYWPGHTATCGQVLLDYMQALPI